ncbi:MAG: fructosamine kinase family protein [Planctomycetota bacterium]
MSELLDQRVTVCRTRSLGGGCISEVLSVELLRHEDRDSAIAENANVTLVVKRQDAEKVSMFEAESEGLSAISESGCIRTPRVLACGISGGSAFLVMEAIDSGRAAGDGFHQFGRDLASFHLATKGTQIGWSGDNFLGSATQPNSPRDSWEEFVRDQRLGYQLKWAVDQGLADSKLKQDVESILDSIGQLLSGRERVTSLLHGDLWSGNYLFDDRGVVLIDPAVSYGCREAEWGMISWFGSCPESFEQGYREVWPMPEGWHRRVAVYRLYHQLNHLNLFGSSYLGTCSSAAQAIRQAV